MLDRPLFVNPNCFFTANGNLPAEFATLGHLDNFALQGNMAWIRNSGPTVLQPFWLGTELSARLAGVRGGETAPANLSAGQRQTLRRAGVLVPENHASESHQRWAAAVCLSEGLFQQKGYAPLGGLIHPYHVAALRRYYRRMIRAGQLALGDNQSPRRYVAHNESVARFFHHQLTAAVSAVVGEPVKPSYVYLASYQGGARLERHTDREQCEFSITFCLDYSPEPRLETPWPLFLHPPSGTVEVFQAIGDALLYRGRDLPHSRNRLPQGHTSTSIFFHYVREGFAGSLD